MKPMSSHESNTKIRIEIGLPKQDLAALDNLAEIESESRGVLVRKAVKLLLEQQATKKPLRAA